MSNVPKLPQMVRDLCDRNLYREAEMLEKSLKTSGEYKIGPYPGSVNTELWLSKLLTKNEELIKLKDDIRAIAPLDDPVLITGETGTGKELVARALHAGREGKFIPINCTSLPDYLLESELFGHAKGSFTGALVDKVGIFQEAQGGTVFLDEIGDMPGVLQAKLLRVIQDSMIRRVGANNEIPINCRFLFATNRNIRALIGLERFREDLYQRISRFEIHLPPLRERMEPDIQLLITALDTQHNFPYKEWITKADWASDRWLPGNVRDIQKLMRRWIVLGRLD